MSEFGVTDLPVRSTEFWDQLTDLVTTKVGPVLGRNALVRAPVAAYLRDLEAVARQENAGAAALQVISSARRLLGERSEVEPAPAPFVQRLD